MFSLITIFSLMMLPAVTTLVISIVVSIFENNSSTFNACDNHSLSKATA